MERETPRPTGPLRRVSLLPWDTGAGRCPGEQRLSGQRTASRARPQEPEQRGRPRHPAGRGAGQTAWGPGGRPLSRSDKPPGSLSPSLTGGEQAGWRADPELFQVPEKWGGQGGGGQEAQFRGAFSAVLGDRCGAGTRGSHGGPRSGL